MSEDGRVRAVDTVIYEAIPKVVMCGHIHLEKPYTVYRYEYGTLYIKGGQLIETQNTPNNSLIIHT